MENFEGLSPCVLGTHIDNDLHPEAGTGDRSGHTMLSGTCFGNDTSFAEMLSQEDLANCPVDFM